MPSDKPLFESRDLGSTDPGNSDLFDLSETGDTDEASGKGSAKKYAGRERRSENRRSHHDHDARSVIATSQQAPVRTDHGYPPIGA